MQPAKYEESKKVAAHHDITDEFFLYMDLNGAILKTISYGSRACTDMERKCHSFVGEAESGRCAIERNRKYIWGCHFYWMCDCKVIEGIL